MKKKYLFWNPIAIIYWKKIISISIAHFYKLNSVRWLNMHGNTATVPATCLVGFYLGKTCFSRKEPKMTENFPQSLKAHGARVQCTLCPAVL